MKRIRIKLSTQFGKKHWDESIKEGETQDQVIERVISIASHFHGDVVLISVETIN